MNSDELAAKLSEPFEPDEVKWKPQAVKGDRALAIAYVDARVVMDRLDDVFGLGCWQDEYEPLPDGSVVCRLRIRVGDEWLTKSDVGGPSEQPDEGDRMKAAFSDALKRAAVKLGIGRYLYRLPHSWVDYDPQKRAFKSQPKLPGWAMPKRAPAANGQHAKAEQPKAEQPRSATLTPGELSLDWRQHFVNKFAACKDWPCAKAAHAEMTKEIWELLQPLDREEFKLAWSKCRSRLEPKEAAAV